MRPAVTRDSSTSFGNVDILALQSVKLPGVKNHFHEFKAPFGRCNDNKLTNVSQKVSICKCIYS